MTHPPAGPSTPTPNPGPKTPINPIRDLFRVVGAVAVAIAESLSGRTA